MQKILSRSEQFTQIVKNRTPAYNRELADLENYRAYTRVHLKFAAQCNFKVNFLISR